MVMRQLTAPQLFLRETALSERGDSSTVSSAGHFRSSFHSRYVHDGGGKGKNAKDTHGKATDAEYEIDDESMLDGRLKFSSKAYLRCNGQEASNSINIHVP